MSTRARRVAVTEECPGPVPPDYADAFAIAVDATEAPDAEQVARTALDGLPPLLGVVVRGVHRHVLRFRLGPPSAPDHIGGWRIVSARPEVIVLRAESPVLTGHIVGRRSDGGVAGVTTFLHYERPRLARAVWAVVGLAHRAIAPRLLERGALHPMPSPSAGGSRRRDGDERVSGSSWTVPDLRLRPARAADLHDHCLTVSVAVCQCVLRVVPDLNRAPHANEHGNLHVTGLLRM